MHEIGVAIVGSQFISKIHYDGLVRCPAARVVASCSRTEEHARQFAESRDIPHWYTDYRKMYERDDVDLVVLGVPNDLHCPMVCDAAAAGKHVVLEKPMALSLAECDQMNEACKTAGVKLMYAEELCFAPKYVRLKQLLEQGAFGKPHLVKQCEKHDGPHSPWFWDVSHSGGGVALDMGCHAIQFFRWLLSGPDCENPPRAKSVYAHLGTYVHNDKTQGDDEATIIIEFEGDVTGIAEESWAKPGGMDDRAELYGSEGVAYADLLRGNAVHTYSKSGYDYAVEKAGATQGWTFTIYEEDWNYGFPQELEHFVDCVLNDRKPIVTGDDGRAVMEIIMAAYASAGSGKKIDLPYETDAKRPIDLWRPAAAG